jgi:uncharacterized protein
MLLVARPLPRSSHNRTSASRRYNRAVPRFRTTPFTINVRDLVNRPGEQREHVLAFPAPEQYGEAVAIVPKGTPLTADVRLESVHEGILISGKIRTRAAAECVRCLKPLDLPVKVEFQELFAYSLADGFDYEVQDDHVDLEDIVRDAVVLSLPFQPVCADGCSEIELGDGVTLVLADDDSPSAIDPRWAALAGFASGDDADQEDV